MTTTSTHHVFHWLQHVTTSIVLPCLLYFLSLGKTLHEAFYIIADDIPILGQVHGLYVWFRAAFWLCRWSIGRSTADSANETLTVVAVDLAANWDNAVEVFMAEFESLTSQINYACDTILGEALTRQVTTGFVLLGLSTMLLAYIFVLRPDDRKRLQSTQIAQLTSNRTVRFSPTQEIISNAPADNDGSRYLDLVETRPGIFSPVKRCSRLRGSSI